MYNQRKCMCFTVAATTKLPSRVDAVFGYSLKSTTITNVWLYNTKQAIHFQIGCCKPSKLSENLCVVIELLNEI